MNWNKIPSLSSLEPIIALRDILKNDKLLEELSNLLQEIRDERDVEISLSNIEGIRRTAEADRAEAHRILGEANREASDIKAAAQAESRKIREGARKYKADKTAEVDSALVLAKDAAAVAQRKEAQAIQHEEDAKQARDEAEQAMKRAEALEADAQAAVDRLKAAGVKF